MSFLSENSSKVEVQLPNGEVCPIEEVIRTNPYTLGFNLPYYYDIIKNFLHLDVSHRSLCFLITRHVDKLPEFDSEKLNHYALKVHRFQ